MNSETESKAFPLFGLGFLSNVEESRVVFCLLLLEVIFFVFLEEISWNLLAVSFLIYYGTSFKTEVELMIKKLTLFFLHDAEADTDQDVSDDDQTVIEENDDELNATEDVLGAAVFTPDKESVGWINDIIEMVWDVCIVPYVEKEDINDFLEQLANDLEEDDNKAAASVLKEISVDKISLDHCPFQVSKMIAYARHRDELYLNIRISYAGNSEVVLKWKDPEMFASGRLLGFSLKVQVAAAPIHRDLSILGGLELKILEPPTVLVQGGGLFYIPVELVKTVLWSTMKPLLEWFVLGKRSVKLSLADGIAHWPKMGEPEGLLRLVLVEARDLIAADRHLLETCGVRCVGGTSDPYCAMKVDRRLIYSNIVKKSLNPVWNFFCEFPRHRESGSKELIIEVLDKDIGAADDTLGSASLDLGGLDEAGEVSDFWVDVSNVEVDSGQIRLRMQWVPCQDTPEDDSKSNYSNSPGSKAILMVHVKSVQTNFKVEPVISLQVSGDSLQTTAKGEFCQHHEFEEEMMLLVKDPEKDTLNISLFDLGSRNLSTTYLLKEGLSLVQDEQGEVLCPARVAHKRLKNLDGFPRVGDYVVPVNIFKEEKDLILRLNSCMDIEARVSISAKLWYLKTPSDDVTY